MHAVDTHALSGPALATARRAAHLRGRHGGGGHGSSGGSERRASFGILRALQRLGLGGRAARRTRGLLVGASLACALVLCTVAIISGGDSGNVHGGGVGDGGGDGDRSFPSVSSFFIPSFSSSSFSFGRRALLQAAGAAAAAAAGPASSNATNTAGGAKEDEPDSWGQLSTIVAVSLSGASTALSAYNQRRLAAAEAERKEAEKLAKKKMKQLQLEQTMALKRREVAEAEREAVDNLMTHYKKPMLAAAFDLQSRLKNMVNGDFMNQFMHKRWESAEKKGDMRAKTDREYALYNTMYLFGEFFGWMEVIRKEIVFLHGGAVQVECSLPP
jgi:hypothetical protein